MSETGRVTSADARRAAMDETTRYAREAAEAEARARHEKTEKLKALRLSKAQ